MKRYEYFLNVTFQSVGCDFIIIFLYYFHRTAVIYTDIDRHSLFKRLKTVISRRSVNYSSIYYRILSYLDIIPPAHYILAYDNAFIKQPYKSV